MPSLAYVGWVKVPWIVLPHQIKELIVKVINIIAQLVLIIGGLNWGLIGLAQYDIVSGIFGGDGAIGAGQGAVLPREHVCLAERYALLKPLPPSPVNATGLTHPLLKMARP